MLLVVWIRNKSTAEYAIQMLYSIICKSLQTFLINKSLGEFQGWYSGN